MKFPKEKLIQIIKTTWLIPVILLAIAGGLILSNENIQAGIFNRSQPTQENKSSSELISAEEHPGNTVEADQIINNQDTSINDGASDLSQTDEQESTETYSETTESNSLSLNDSSLSQKPTSSSSSQSSTSSSPTSKVDQSASSSVNNQTSSIAEGSTEESQDSSDSVVSSSEESTDAISSSSFESSISSEEEISSSPNDVDHPLEPVEPTNPEAESSKESSEKSPATDTTLTEAEAKAEIGLSESNNNYKLVNGRYIGKYQLDHIYLDHDYSPENQELAADNYVSTNYGSWVEALAFYQENGWY